MTGNRKNYTEQGGEITHIGGKLIIDEGASVEGLSLPGSSGEKMANQAASTATTVTALRDDFNVLLASLKAAGLMLPDSESIQPEQGQE